MHDVAFSYGPGEFGLRVAALAVAPGSRTACIGPSGSGKTTLVRLIAGITSPARGTVRVGGVEVSALPDAERRAFRLARIGMMFQEFELLDYLTALDNLLLPYHVRGGAGPDAATRDRARALAAATGIEHTLRRRPAALSQGERQRLAICRALVTEPPLVICDEPTGNLDPRSTDAALELLFAQVERLGSTLLMVTHDHGLLSRFDRVIDVRELEHAA